MRIFVGYGYNERDKWVEDYVLPLLVAFGCEVVHGKAVYGGALLRILPFPGSKFVNKE